MPTITKVKGGVKGGRAMTGRHPHQRFRSGRKHPDRPQTVALRGAVAAVGLGRSGKRREGVSSPLATPHRRPGCSRACTRRGPCFGMAFPHALPASTRATFASQKVLPTSTDSPPRTIEKEASVSLRRGSNARSRCARVSQAFAVVGRRRLAREARNRSLPNRRSIHADGA